MWTGRTVYAEEQQPERKFAQANKQNPAVERPAIEPPAIERPAKRREINGMSGGKQDIDQKEIGGAVEDRGEEEYQKNSHPEWSLFSGVNFGGGGSASGSSPFSWLKGPGQDIGDDVPVGGNYKFPNRDQFSDSTMTIPLQWEEEATNSRTRLISLTQNDSLALINDR